MNGVPLESGMTYSGMLVGATISAAVLVTIERVVDHVLNPRPPAQLRGMWVTADGTTAVVITKGAWAMHAGIEGYTLRPADVDHRTGEARGEVFCTTHGRRVGRFTLSQDSNSNRLRLDIRREGVPADEPKSLGRPI